MSPEEIDRAHAVVDFVTHEGFDVMSFGIHYQCRSFNVHVGNAVSLLAAYDLLTSPKIGVHPVTAGKPGRMVSVAGRWNEMDADLFAAFENSPDIASIDLMPRDRSLLIDLVANASMEG